MLACRGIRILGESAEKAEEIVRLADEQSHIIKCFVWKVRALRRVPCARLNHMQKRAIRIVKHLGMVPCVAACTVCSKQFQAPLSALQKIAEATASLQKQFDLHKCSDPTPGQDVKSGS